jgi:hypothetical protein
MMWAFFTSAKLWIKKKNHVNKNQGWEPIHQKYKAINKHKPKGKKKTNNQQKSGKDPMQKGLMATK